MNPVSGEFDPLTPKKFPTHATRVPGRSPALKYQQKQHAVVALKGQLKERSPYSKYPPYMANIQVFKYNPDTQMYDVIFDHASDLAKEFLNDRLTKDELVDTIDW